MTSGYLVPAVWLTTPIRDVSQPDIVYRPLVGALTDIHRRKHVGEFTLGSVHFEGVDICAQCSVVFPCRTMMLVSHECRVEWSRLWSPPKPVPTAVEVAAWR